MSDAEVAKVETEDENKTPDKKQIEEEEKEVMLKSVDATERPIEQKIIESEGPVTTALSGTVTDEGREVKPKFIPIGAIKMPGFFTRNSDKEKDQEDEIAECEDKEKSEGQKPKRRRLQFLHTCPFTQFLHHPRSEDKSNLENHDDSKQSIVERLRIPLNTMLRKSTNKDPEAALASMETLEDKIESNNDGMENVKLDEDEIDEGKVATKLPLKERFRQRKFIIDDIVVCVVALLVLAAVVAGALLAARAGPPSQRALRAGRYMATLASCGPLEGTLDEGVYKFYGIPYAVPPVGDRRFTNAQPLDNISYCWNDTLHVHEPAPVCYQILENRTIIGQEDCLTLDVVTPHVRYDYPLPVIVLIGANSLAGGIGPLQPSAMYSRTKEVVFVRPNFRVGALGFLALDILSKDKYPPSSGNYGLSDLLVALQWVKHNIKHFGGDPDSVTLFGHRAGATLAAALTTVKKAQKLYSRVWLSSPTVIYPGLELEEAQKMNEAFKRNTNCIDAACLRKMSPLEVLTATPDVWTSDTITTLPQAQENSKSWLILDGELLRTHAYEVWDEQFKQKHNTKDYKPIVFGTTQHSAHAEKLMLKHVNWTAENVEEAVNNSAIKQEMAVELYKYFNKTYMGLVELTSAIRMVCPLVGLARMRLSVPMYVVRGEGAGAGLRGSQLAPINSDVEAILGTFDSDTPEQRRFMSAMQQLFYYFVWHNRLPGPDSGFIAVGQDLLLHTPMPACDLLIKQDIVPRFSHVD